MSSVLQSSDEASAVTGLVHRYYLPDGASLIDDSTDVPLVLLVHGRGGNAGVMWPFARLLPHQCFPVIAPQAFLADTEVGGFSWWASQCQDSLQPARAGQMIPGAVGNDTEPRVVVESGIDVACRRLEVFVERALAYYSLGKRRVLAMGFSQGAGLLTSLSLNSGVNFQAVVSLAGFLPKVARCKGVTSASLPPYFFAHGSKDKILPLGRVIDDIEWLESIGADVTLVTDDVGHKVGVNGQKRLSQWIADL